MKKSLLFQCLIAILIVLSVAFVAVGCKDTGGSDTSGSGTSDNAQVSKDALNAEIALEIKEQGDYTLVKTDEGYQLLYYVSGEEGWILYCEISVSLEKVDALIDEQLENNPMKVTYGKVYLGS